MQFPLATRGRAPGTDASRELSFKVEAEYRDMPGLSLTLVQAQRLWAADQLTCHRAFARLVSLGFLRLTRGGQFVRTHVAGTARPARLKSEYTRH